MTAIQFIVLAFSFFLVACQSIDRPQPEAVKTALKASLDTANAYIPVPPAAMPDAVQHELSSGSLLSGLEPVLDTERRFDVSANNIDAKVFFASLMQGTPLSVAVHPEVKGVISLSLKGVTLTEVLQVVEEIYGYEISREGRILRIFPVGMRTETFPLNYLYMERDGLSLTTVSSGRISDQGSSSTGTSESTTGSNSTNNTNGTFISSRTKTDFWSELKVALTSIIGNLTGGRQVVVMPQAGLVTVRAYPNELREVRHFLHATENHLQRQVILEAKILEVRLSEDFQQGIQWDNVLLDIGQSSNTAITFGTTGESLSSTIATAIGGVTSLSVKGTDFSTMINLLDTQGDVDVLSSPRVTASNNQKAVIKVGTDEYFVTDVSSTTVSGTTTVTSPEVELTPFFSGIALDVTPQIDSDGNVLLHVHPSVINVSEQTKDVKLSDSSLALPLAQSEIRESDTVIRAASGDVVIIGGLMKSESFDKVSQVPILSSIPLLGELFKNRSKQKQKTELIILIKPTVVGGDTWKNELRRSQDLLEHWYPSKK